MGAVKGDSLVEVFLRGAPCRAGDFVERKQDPLSDRPSQDTGHRGANSEANHGPQQQLMQILRSLVVRAELGSSGERLFALGRQGARELAVALRDLAGREKGRWDL